MVVGREGDAHVSLQVWRDAERTEVADSTSVVDTDIWRQSSACSICYIESRS